MGVSSLILAAGMAIGGPPAGTHWHGAAYPVESGRPRQSAHAARPRALHSGPRDWYVVVRPQHRRLGPSAVPAQRRILQPGLLLHSASERRGAWLRVYDSAGKSWVSVGNVRPAQEPRGWGKTVIQIHPSLRHVRTVSHLPSPLPVANAAPAASAGVAAATPESTVVAVPQVVQPAERTPEQSIYFWASQYGVNGDSLLRTAQCESGLNAGAYNPSGASGGLQFMPSTFAAYAGQLSWDHAPSYWNFDDSARVAAYMWSQGQQRQWVCYGMVG